MMKDYKRLTERYVEEEAKKKVYDNLVATKQLKPADYIKINVATEVNV